MKDITSAFNQAVKKELKEKKDYYEPEFGYGYVPEGYWCNEFTHLKDPFFVQSARQDIDSTLAPQSLWHGLWHQGEMCCLFGEPNVGKSVLANMMAYEIASSGLPVLYIDFENSPHQAAARYHNPNDEHSQLYIPDNISFVTVNPCLNYRNTRDYSMVLDAIEREFVTRVTPVVIIDDISHICPLRDCTAAQEVMRRMRQWIIKYSVSILVIAHAVRHRSACPLTITSLFGASHTAYCFDSIFAIGRDLRDDKCRYIKQLKSRITAINYGDNNVISVKLLKAGNFLCFDILGAGHIERDLLAIPEITDRYTLRAEVTRLHNLDWSARQIANRLSLSHTTINTLIAEIELSQSSKVETVESVETMENQDKNVATEQNEWKPSDSELDGESSGKSASAGAANSEPPSTQQNEWTSDSVSLFSPEIRKLAEKTGIPSVPSILESPSLPFSDWKPGDDPNISQICLYHKDNPLYNLLTSLHSTYLYSSYDNFSLHVHDYDSSTDYRFGSLVYSPSVGMLGRADVGVPRWFDGTIPSGTTIDVLEQQLHDAAAILRDKVLVAEAPAPAGRLNPSCLTPNDIESAALTVGIPSTILARALYLPL